jgi:CRP/FNR family transcriptional regulator, cyclic AMP receptor protein
MIESRALRNALRTALTGVGDLKASDQDLEAVAACGETIVYRPGDMLFAQGNPPEYCHLVVRGVAELYRTTDRERVMARIESGRFAGDIAVVLGVPYLSSARAVTYAEIHWFERGMLLDVLAERPAVALGWLRSAMSELAAAHGRLDVVLGRSAKQQVAGALIDAADSDGRVDISQTGLASLLGVGRQTINRALAELMNDGYLRTGYRYIEILDRPGLTELFEGVDLPTH